MQTVFHPVMVRNTVFKEHITEAEVVPAEYTKTEQNVMEVVDQMRQNKYIYEKKYGDISSFNFTSEAFYDKKWNEQTIKARGLFINTVNGTDGCSFLSEVRSTSMRGLIPNLVCSSIS